MIHIQFKRYQVVFWMTEDRSGAEPALRLDFDTLAEAKATFDAHQGHGLYRTGILLEWHKRSGAWDLIDMFPAPTDGVNG